MHSFQIFFERYYLQLAETLCWQALQEQKKIDIHYSMQFKKKQSAYIEKKRQHY